MSIQEIKFFFAAHKVTVILVAVITFLVIGGFLIFQNISSFKQDSTIEEIDLSFDPEGPYALLFPRRDGNALILNLKRTASYDSISYELAYTSKPDETIVKGTKTEDGEENLVAGSIDRGVVGNIDTKDRKGEYEQEILFGTCSKNVCKYDKGVENGTLTLHIKKGNQAYRMVTQWHIQKPDVALGLLTSGDDHFKYRMVSSREELSSIGFTIVNEVTGVPKLPNEKEVLGKVYALNAPIPKQLSEGEVSLEIVDAPPGDAKITRYDFAQNKWVELETHIDGSKLQAKSNSSGIFALLTPKK